MKLKEKNCIHNFLHGFFCLFCVFIFLNCLSCKKIIPQNDEADVEFSYELPQEQLSEALAKSFLSKMRRVADSGSAQGLTLADFLRLLPLKPNEATQINARRPQPPIAQCDSQDRCEVVQSGDAFSISFANVSMGSFGKPIFNISKKVVMQFRALPAPAARPHVQILEICRVSGVQIKKGLGLDVNGAILEFDSKKAQGSRVKATINAGPGGGYPHSLCAPKPK